MDELLQLEEVATGFAGVLQLVAARILAAEQGKCNQISRLEDPPG